MAEYNTNKLISFYVHKGLVKKIGSIKELFMITETANFLRFHALGTAIILAINVSKKDSISVSRFPKKVLIVDLETDVFRSFLNHLFRFLICDVVFV